MSYNVTLPPHDVTKRTGNSKLEDSIFDQRSHSRGRTCPCNIYSFNNLEEAEGNLAPGFPVPQSYMPWMVRPPFPQTDAHMIPQTGFKQPDWYQPRFFGWQYATRASQVTSHQSTLLELENESFTTKFQFMRYHTAGYQTTGLHATEYQATGHPTMGIEATQCNVTGIKGYQVSGFHATGFRAIECQATGFSLDSENTLARNLGGLAYDHGEFPKIMSVHSMAERQDTVQQYSASTSDSVKVVSNVVGPLSGPAVNSGVFLYSKNSPVANRLLGHEIYDYKDRLQNDGDDHSGYSSMESCLNESKVGCKTVTEKEFTNHSISTILSSARKTDSHSSQFEDNCHLKNPSGVINQEEKNSVVDQELEREWLCATTEKEGESSDAENDKMSSNGAKSPNLAEISSNPVLESDNLNEVSMLETEAQTLSWEKSSEQLVNTKKQAMIVHRIQKVKNIQSSLKRYEQSQHCRTRKKKKIKYLSNGESCIPERSPSNSAPVKMSPSTPNKEMTKGQRDVERHVETAQIEKSFPLKENNSKEEDSFRSERPRKFSGSGMYRMNVFEKLGLLKEQNRPSTELSNCSADRSEKNSQTSPFEETGANVPEVLSEANGERFSPEFNSVYSEDIPELKESYGQIFVKSADTEAAVQTLETLTTGNSSNLRELPNNWSSAYVFANRPKFMESCDMPKRQHIGEAVLYDEPSAKRPCKTAPREDFPVRTGDFGTGFGDDFYHEMPLQDQKNEENAQEWENSAAVPEESNETGSSISKFATTVDSEFITPRVYEDDTLQRNHELRESKINNLIRKQEGLLQALEKMSSKTHLRDEQYLIP